MKSVDLHVHSTYSDGTLTPAELVVHAKEMNLSAIALTDHDTVAGVQEAVAAGKEQDLEIVPGVELSTFFDEKEIHIVGLYIDYTDETFKKELEILQERRVERNRLMCERFCSLGIPVSYKDLCAQYGEAVITRAHFADYLLQNGFVRSRNEAFDRYIGSNGPCYVPRQKVPPAKAIELIRAAKGVPILAHPVLYRLGTRSMDKLMQELCRNGIAGLEAIYSTYSTGEELQMRKLAKAHHLILSGGSDYHGANKPNIELGTGRGRLFVPYDILEEIKKLRG